MVIDIVSVLLIFLYLYVRICIDWYRFVGRTSLFNFWVPNLLFLSERAGPGCDSADKGLYCIIPDFKNGLSWLMIWL